MPILNQQITEDCIQLLQQLIGIPSLSREENLTAEALFQFFQQQGHSPHKQGNNIWVVNQAYHPDLPTILLNSHHDTVKPTQGWTYEPFTATLEDDKLTGLGSNDAGGPLVSLIATFLHYAEAENLPFNLIIAATAEEEISGKNGIASILEKIGPVDLGIIGEPTQMQMAISEKGLMVLDCYAKGKSGHAAREEGINAIYQALRDIQWFREFEFEEVSPFLGKVKMSVTQIDAGIQHNVVPDSCHYVVDVRTNELYSNQEAFRIIDQAVASEVKPRSFRLNSSRLPVEHPIVQKGISMGRKYFGSPTLSDQALIPYPTLKIGPGDSARSHTPNEYILLPEIREGIDILIKLLEGLELRS
ncbi:MAG: M20 family metallo-hydrolase [Bacteroidota bacterium]